MDWSEAITSGSIPLSMEQAEPARTWPQSINEFEALIEQYQHRLVQFAFCRLQSQPDAEDVVQDVLVQTWRDREKHKGVDHVGAFLFRMVANRCTDRLRQQRKRGSVSLDDMEPRAAADIQLDSVEAAKRQRWIDALLARLPERQAEVIRLRIYGDLPFEVVAQTINCSVPTVKSRFRYGIQKLRRVLQHTGGER